MTAYPASLLCDFYKVSHRAQYPAGTQYVYSTWIPRESRIPGIKSVVAFGIQGFIQEFLIDYFDEHFFGRPKADVLAEYDRVLRYALGDPDPDHSHIEALWELGFLPLEIRAVPEGTRVPIRVPMATIENTRPEFFWLTNYIETLFSAEVWLPTTSATIAAQYRKILNFWALETTGSTAGVEFQGHDFSMRGMTSLQSAAKSGAGHLLSFSGTDTIPAIHYLERYYGADIEKELVGASIPATEHSVMCANGQDEVAAFERIVTEVYPAGLVSVVSDTWDLWKVITEVLPALKDKIMARDGKLVIRPDSGDPVDIICGLTRQPQSPDADPASKGVIELLWDIFGGTVTEQGFKVLDRHIGAIYGDSITLDRAESMCRRLYEKGFASTNIVLGIGSFTYQYQTRDTFGFALKSTWVRVNGEERQIFKDPATDVKKVKKSLKGRVHVEYDAYSDALAVTDGLSYAEWDDTLGPDDALQIVFCDGDLEIPETLAEIRERVTA